jgi:tetratricopeptide (TPR) repeat protein
MTRNIAAYDLYRRSQDPVLLRNDSTALLAVRDLTDAIRIDPSFAAAHASLSSMYTRLSFASRPILPQSELKHRAESEARKAIAIDDSLADGHAALGLANAHWPDDLDLAHRELARAAALDSALPHVYEYLALTDLLQGNQDQALSDSHLAIAIDPLSATARATLAGVLYAVGRCDMALPILDSLDAVKPPLLRVAVTRAHCYASEQRWAEANTAIEKMSARGDIRSMGLQGMALAKSGKREEAIAVRAKLREIAKQNSFAHFDIATVSLGLGDMEDVHKELQLAGSIGRFPYEVMGPLFHQFREDEPFASILAARGIHVRGSRVVSSIAPVTGARR